MAGMDRESGPDFSEAEPLDQRNQIQEAYRTHPVAWFRWVFEQIRLGAAARLLELGCGPGQFWLENRERIPGDWRPVLSDLSINMVREARSRLKASSSDLEFCACSAQAIPCPAETFDAILAIGVLDELPNLEEALGEIWRTLKPGGILAATAGGAAHLGEMRDLLSPYLLETGLGGREDRFGLENGAKALARYFMPIDRALYADRLEFTEATPVLDYVFSESQVRRELSEEKLSALVHGVKRKISRAGKISVTVQKGLFLARKELSP